MENLTLENEIKNLFWDELHNFQLQRATEMIEYFITAFGDDAIKVVHEINMDWREPLKLYMKNTVTIIEKFKELYGDKVIEVLKEYNSKDSLKRGQNISANSGNTLDDFLKIFGQGGNIVSRSESEALIRSSGCLVAQVAKELGVENIMYCLHCYGDPYYAKGINPNISCKHNKTLMEGDDCCEYLITIEGQ